MKAITEELCGHRFPASRISAINKRLDASLAEFAGQRLAEPYPYLILDARYERVREAGVIRSQAVPIAVAVGWDGRRSILGVALANRERRSSWRDFLLGLKGRGLPFAGSCPRPLRGSDRASADARWGRVRSARYGWPLLRRRSRGTASAGGRRPSGLWPDPPEGCRRSRQGRAQGGAVRCPGGSGLPALLCSFLAERARSRAAPVSSADPLTSRRGIGRSPMVADNCLQGRTTPSFDRWIDDRRDLAEARRDLAAPSALH